MNRVEEPCISLLHLSMEYKKMWFDWYNYYRILNERGDIIFLWLLSFLDDVGVVRTQDVLVVSLFP